MSAFHHIGGLALRDNAPCDKSATEASGQTSSTAGRPSVSTALRRLAPPLVRHLCGALYPATTESKKISFYQLN